MISTGSIAMIVNIPMQCVCQRFMEHACLTSRLQSDTEINQAQLMCVYFH